MPGVPVPTPALEFSNTAAPSQLSRKCSACEEDEAKTLRSKTTASPGVAVATAPSIVHEVLRSPGESLDRASRAYFEPRFGHDFSQVRIHAGERAAESARAVHALAYTVGSDIVFAAGHYSPTSEIGRRLLAHELTHVVQQGKSWPRAAVQLAADGANATAPASAVASASTTTRLFTLIDGLENVHANAQQELVAGEADPQIQEHVQTLGATLEQMRVVAAGDDETLKQQVLAGFTSTHLEQAEVVASSSEITQQSGVAIAKKALHVSNPQDQAEVEADHVAEAVMSGRPTLSIAVPPPTARRWVLNRQLGEQLVAAGTGTLIMDAEVAPETGPPGWVVGGVVALAALAMIGVGLLMSAPGNVADTGIMAEAQAMIAAGTATDICDALAKLMAATSDSARKLKIKATQKAKGCRHSRAR
jgi:hypothetical protein